MNSIGKSFNEKLRNLLRKSEVENNSIYNRKICNECFEFTSTGGEKKIKFSAIENAIVELNVIFDASEMVQLELLFNGVTIIKKDVVGGLTFKKYIIADLDNELLISFASYDSEVDIKIEVCLNGEINFENALLYNCKKNNNNIYMINNNLLSKSNDIVTIAYNINNINMCESDKYIDVNVNNINGEKLITFIYEDDSKKKYLKNGIYVYDMELIDVNEMCLLSSNNNNYCYNIVYIMNGSIYYRSYNSNMNLVIDKKLEDVEHVAFNRVKSISSDIPLNCFFAKSVDDVWYLIEIGSQGNILHVREYTICADLFEYYYDGVNYVVQLTNNGVVVDKFDSLYFDNKLESFVYKNVDNAFIFDSQLYLVNGFVVQEIDL